ncbi:hypothetical protein PBI_COLTRANE_53 [Microbacterium phage Coltrane]|uniref:Uncharacterized protein n=3 Tax=Armstrongvirus armstrong TaxID=2734217 RepID=A0A3G2KAD1_9CAUD|nr:hypothetical protein PBI_BRAHMS_53 [Microbacterium phage Brahms]AYN57389.1 hypothetical protein PBI_COLTRANE_53 [Microbacterium phage Coltrane]QED11476.1 hypothetical protein SEA_VITAS_53 [Microbacterium phage Vitas]UGL62020.1 hypothetical protein SEA_SKYLORD_53 [Microbacterium phage Skylord]UOK18208.1 hypothetical protein SEA_CLAYDA5_55 [Microbacterium phage Clayda5]
MNKRIAYRQTVNSFHQSYTLNRVGTLTGEVSEAGMLRVQWDEDRLGRMGWVAPNTFEELS